MPRQRIPSIPIVVASFQAPIGGLGLICWLAAFQIAIWLQSHEYILAAHAVSGYIMGYGTAFAGWVFVHIWNGAGHKFIDDGIFRWISIAAVGMVFAFGLAGWFINLYGNTDGWFNTFFWTGGVVMGTCTGPIIDAADGL